MNKLNHGISFFTKYTENRNRFYHEEKTKPVLGGVFLLPQHILAFEYEGDIPEYLPFMVTKIYDHVILLERRTDNRGIHRQSISKWNFRHYAETVSASEYERLTVQFFGVSVPIP